MYSTRSGLTLGFHGCDKTVVDSVLNAQNSLTKSENPYDWLGHGIYFWDNSLNRAIDFATELKNNPNPTSKNTITTPAAIGAVINLGYCLDLLDIENLKLLKSGYEFLKSTMGSALPQNKAVAGGADLLIRNLDCAVIEALHNLRRISGLQSFDSIRGAFWEGDDLYPNAGFKEKNHIQICIINPNCIKGFFLPRNRDDQFARI